MALDAERAMLPIKLAFISADCCTLLNRGGPPGSTRTGKPVHSVQLRSTVGAARHAQHDPPVGKIGRVSECPSKLRVSGPCHALKR